MIGGLNGRPGTHRLSARSNSLGWSLAQIDTAIDALEAAQQREHSSADRVYPRFPFRRESVGVTLLHPGGSQAHMSLASQDISQGGMGLLHSNFLHPGSGCLVELDRVGGGIDRHEARIAGCRHAGGKLHILGVRFGSPIDLSAYLPVALGWRASLEPVSPMKISGSMLLIEPNDADADRIERSMDATLMTTRRVRTGAEASALDISGFNMVACAETLPDISGELFLSNLRLRGTPAPFIMMLSESASGGGIRAADPGIAQVRKPIEGQFLQRVITELLATETARKERQASRAHRLSGVPVEAPARHPESGSSWWESRS